MKLINSVLKETTDEGHALDIYITESKHNVQTPKQWVKEKTHQFVLHFHFTDVINPNYGFCYYIDTILDDHGLEPRGLCLNGHRYDYSSLNVEKMNKVRDFVQQFVTVNQLNICAEANQ